MNTARVSVCLAILLCGTCVGPLFAQGPGYPGANGYGLPPVGQSSATDGSPDTYDIFDNRRLQFRSDIGDGVGYQKGFQTFGAFQPIQVIQDELILFVNPRGIVTYEGQGAFNGGVGSRWYNRDNDRILGLSGWYDFDNTLNNAYNQWGVSFESLGQYLDVRANAYILGNGDRQFIGSFLSGATRFIGNNIGIDKISQFENPLSGGDFEVGGALPGIGDVGLRTYVGGYYYQGEATGGGVYGVRARGESLITQDFWGGVMVTHDRLFGTNVTGAFTWYWGSGQAARWFQRIPVPDRMWQQVERQYRIAVWDDQITDNILALRAGGTGGSGGPVGTPIFVVHVNNGAAAGGDGTFEHPLNSLPTTTAGQVDIVFVNRGNGTSSNMNQGITLNNFQRLLGQGVQHLFTSTQGTFILPGFSAGPLPSITNTSGSAVTLANSNEVSGFNIVGAALNGIVGTGISGTAADPTNINNVNITGSGNAGIQLVNTSGFARVFDSTLNNNAAQGMVVDNTGVSLNLSVDNVTANQNLVGMEFIGNASTFNVTMNDVTANNNQEDGIRATLVGSAFGGVFDNIDASNNNNPPAALLVGHGLTIDANLSSVALTISNSTFDSNNLNGINMVGVNSSAFAVAISGSEFNTNTLNGLFVDLTDSFGAFALTNNTFLNNTEIGAFLRATGGSLAMAATNNTFDGNHGAGLAFTLRNSATGSVDIQNNLFIRQLDLASSAIYNGQGLDVRLDGSTNASAATATLTSGIISNNVFGDFTDATLGNAGAGMIVSADQLTTLQDLTIDSNQVFRNGGNGIQIDRSGSAVVNNVDITNNLVRFNGGDGLAITAAGTANDTNDYTIQNNTFANNPGDGVSFVIQADAQIQADMFDNLITLNGADGISLEEQVNSASNLRFLTGTWQRNQIVDNSGAGIQLDGRLQNLLIGSLGIQADGNLITDNTLNGIEATVGGSVTVARNEIARNGVDGIGLNIGQGVNLAGFNNYDTAVATFATINNNYIHNNTRNGLQILSQGAGGTSVEEVVTVNASFNTISDNGGRGINILNRSGVSQSTIIHDGQANLTFQNNLISGNVLEGVWVINTTSRTQDPNALSTARLDRDGHPASSPLMTFNFLDNLVLGNGSGSAFTTTGLVLRVGTSGGGYFYNYDGGFASEALTGVIANISGTAPGLQRFQGNQGNDVYFDSFTSTVDPATSAGTWSTTEFTVNDYFGDPLARLDLTFLNNTFDTAEVNNAGPPHAGGLTDGGSGAYYDNAEGTFKSRTISTSADTGIFRDADRFRNAQRLGARFTLDPQVPVPPPPNGGFDSGDFLYPGMGQSTFRLLGVPAPGNVGSFNPTGNVGAYVGPFTGFAVDNFYTGIFDANGVSWPVVIEQMPWGWNVNGGNPRPQ